MNELVKETKGMGVVLGEDKAQDERRRRRGEKGTKQDSTCLDLI